MKGKKSIGVFLLGIKDWIVSYLIVLIIPIVICSVFFLYTYYVIWEETENSNTIALQIVASELDDIFEKTFSAEYAIQRNGDIQDVVTMEQPLDAMKRFRLVKATQALNNCIGESVISSWLLYYPNSEMALVTGNGYLNLVESYEHKGKHYGYTHEEWELLLKQRNNKKFLINADSGNIAYIFTLPMHKMIINMNVILELDSNYIQNILSKLDDMNGGILLTDVENHILISRNIKQDNLENFSMETVTEDGYQSITLNGAKMMASSIQLKKAGLKVVSVIPYKEFWSTALSSLTLFYFALELCIFTGLAVSYFFSVWKYRTWGKLNALAKVRIENSKSRINSRNKEIAEAIDDIVEEYDTMQKQLVSVDTMKRELLLRSVLKGRIRADEIEQVFMKNDVVFEVGNYVVTLLKLNSFERFFEVCEQEGNEQDIRLVKKTVISIIQELNQEFPCEILNVDENIVCIVDFGSLDMTECYEQVEQFSHKCHELLMERLSVLLTISISDVHKHIFSLQNAYSEAFRVMEYQKALDDESVMNYMEMVKKTQVSYFYSVENESTLIHWILEGKEKEALQLFEEIYEKNLINICSSDELAKCLKWNLTASVLRAENVLRDRIELENTQNLLEDITKQATLHEAKFILTERIKQICEEVSKTKGKKGDFIAEQVKAYIQENYTNPNLSNSQIADYFDMNITYLSTFFKDKTGLNLLSYIQKVRLNRAKELLKTTDLTLEEISKMVGINNSVSLTRLFKKYESVTPAVYRKESRCHSDASKE